MGTIACLHMQQHTHTHPDVELKFIKLYLLKLHIHANLKFVQVILLKLIGLRRRRPLKFYIFRFTNRIYARVVYFSIFLLSI